MTGIRHIRLLSVALAAAVLAGSYALRESAVGPETAASYILQGTSLEAVSTLVQHAGGEITHELGVIRAVAANLTPSQVEALEHERSVRRVYGNGAIELAGKPGTGGSGNGGNYTVSDTHFAALVKADDVHAMGITGDGVGIAVLDSGLWKHDGIKYDMNGYLWNNGYMWLDGYLWTNSLTEMATMNSWVAPE